MPQDAGLGRGTASPYLDILNHIGIQYDENAPTGVSDEVMRAIGPDGTVRRLQEQWSALEVALANKYGRSTKAKGADKAARDQKWNELRAARQQQRRKVAKILRKDYFEKRNNQELDRQLDGTHGPQQPLQKVIFSLPERRRLAEILGDLDEDLPEDQIVCRKIEAINAWVEYAWKIEPKEPAWPQNQVKLQAPSFEAIKQVEKPQLSLEGTASTRAIAPKPWYASMIQDPISPPPPYSEIDGGHIPNRVVAGMIVNGTSSPPGESKKSHECIFCERQFTRKGTMWDCTERHLRRRATETVPCPLPDCKSKGTVLKNEIDFKNHVISVHKRSLRPIITIRSTGEAKQPVPSARKITLRWREKTASPKIVLRLKRRT